MRSAFAEQVELALGDPADDTNPAGLAALRTADLFDEFPAGAVALLDELRVFDHYVPVAYGGALADYADILSVVRTMARRSVTLAVAHGKTFLGSVCAWVVDDPASAQRVADLVRTGRAVSWGLTERGHGSDLLSGELTLTGSDTDGLRLDGQKWLINNATRGSALTLLVRSKPEGGPRGFDLVFFDKDAHEPTAFTPLPKELTHGIRGADISGIEIHGAPVTPADRLGQPGTGLEYVMKSLQLTRTMCCSLSLGAGDQGLRAAYDFAAGRSLYGRELLDLPDARRRLSDALADQLLGEAFATVAARSIHTHPGELSVHCAAAKFLVPTRTEAMLRSLRTLVGARSVLDDDPSAPNLARIERDHRIVSLFDGNTVVNLQSLIGQFSLLHGKEPLPAASVRDCCDLSAPVEPLNPAKLRLLSRQGSSLLRAFGDAATQLAAAGHPAAAVAAELAELTEHTLAEAGAQVLSVTDTPNAAFVLAERLALLIAVAAAVHLWRHNEPAEDHPLWHDGLWLTLVLDRARTALTSAPTDRAPAHDAAVAAMTALRERGRLFSLFDRADQGETR